MATKVTTLVVTFLLFLFVALACVVVEARTKGITEATTSTTGVNLLARHSAAVEQAIYPQAGCRCCFFKKVGAFLQCAKVCCKDGCC